MCDKTNFLAYNNLDSCVCTRKFGVFGVTVHLGVYGYYIELYCSVVVCFCAHNKLTIFCLRCYSTRGFWREEGVCLGTFLILKFSAQVRVCTFLVNIKSNLLT